MACKEIEALRLALLNCSGTDDPAARKHAKDHLGDALEHDGPINALANAEDLDSIKRHLDAALVDLEEQITATDEDSEEYDYLRGRLLVVRDAENAIDRLHTQMMGVYDGLGDVHDLLHETFPGDK